MEGIFSIAKTLPPIEFSAFQAASEAWQLSCTEDSSLLYWKQVLNIPTPETSREHTDSDLALAISLSEEHHNPEPAVKISDITEDEDRVLQKRGRTYSQSSQGSIDLPPKKRKHITQTKTEKLSVNKSTEISKWVSKLNPLETQESDSEDDPDLVSEDREDGPPSKGADAGANAKELQDTLNLGPKEHWTSRNIGDLTRRAGSLSLTDDSDSDSDSDDDSESDAQSTDPTSANDSSQSALKTGDSAERDVKNQPISSSLIAKGDATNDDVAILVGSKIFYIGILALKEHSDKLANWIEQRGERKIIQNDLLAIVSPSDFAALQQFVASGEFYPLLMEDSSRGPEEFTIPHTSLKPVDQTRPVSHYLLNPDADTGTGTPGEHEATLLRLGRLLALAIQLETRSFADSVLTKLQHGFPRGYPTRWFLVFARGVFSGIRGRGVGVSVTDRHAEKARDWIARVLAGRQNELALNRSRIGDAYWELVDDHPELQARLSGGGRAALSCAR